MSKYCIVLHNSTYNTYTSIVILYYCTIVRIVTILDNTLQYCEVLFSVFTCIVISIVPPTSSQPVAVPGSASGAASLYHCQHIMSRVDPSFLQSGSGYPSPCIWGTPLPPARAARRRHARRPGQRQHARRRRARSRSRQSCCSCCSTAALASRPSRWGLWSCSCLPSTALPARPPPPRPEAQSCFGGTAHEFACATKRSQPSDDSDLLIKTKNTKYGTNDLKWPQVVSSGWIWPCWKEMSMNKPQLGAISTKAPSCRGRSPSLDMHIHKQMADLAECSTPCNHWHLLLVWDSELKSESRPNCLSCRERPPSLDRQKLWYILLAAFAECSTPCKTRHSLIDQTVAPASHLIGRATNVFEHLQ